MSPPSKPTVPLPPGAVEPAADASVSPGRKPRSPGASEKLAGLKPLFGHRDTRKPSIGKIFVRIPSYRDPELAPTLADMVAKADRPRDLSFGICLQDDGEMKLPDLSSAGRVHWQRFPFSQSLGVGWARHLCETMYGGEEFTLSLDSHHRFVPGWDRILLRMAESLGHDRYVITSYPPAYDPAPGGESKFEQTPNTIVCKGLSEHGTTIREPAPLTQFLYQARPMETPFYAAGFAFSPASFLSDVPADPDIYFQGEEDAMAVRAYTHGYKLYCPHRIVCWHLYGRTEQPHHWSDHVDGNPQFNWKALERAGIARFRKLVGIDPRSDEDDFARFDLGHERSLDEYEAFAGFAYPRPRAARPPSRLATLAPQDDATAKVGPSP